LIWWGAAACSSPKSDSGDTEQIESIETGDSAGGDSVVETAEDSHSGDSTETDTPEMDMDGDGHLSEEHGGADCDDGNPEVHPDSLERLANGLDDDCDGVVDTLDAEDATAMFVELEIGGGAGLAVAGVGDMNGTGERGYAIGAPFS